MYVFRLQLYTHHEFEDVVAHVSGVVAKRPGGRVREDNWGERVSERVQHRLIGHVRQVDHHPEPVHLAN